MMDALFAVRERWPDDAPWAEHGLERGAYGVVTLHRPSNVDEPERLASLVDGLRRVAGRLPLIWPVHPRTNKQLRDSWNGDGSRLSLIEPVGYRVMTALVAGAAVVITDSGGLQEETTALGVPCVTVRESTERPITISEGTNRLVNWPPTAAAIEAAVNSALAQGCGPGSRAGVPAGWDGCAAIRIVEALERFKGGLGVSPSL